MSIITSTTAPVTLSPANQNVTITGDLSGAGAYHFTALATNYGAYYFTFTVLAAVQAGTEASFNILNTGDIHTDPSNVETAGIILGQPGIVTNQGTIEGASGLVLANYHPGAYIKNAGLIAGLNSYGVGIVLSGPAGIVNTGTVIGGNNALLLYNGGIVSNAGLIASGAFGIYLRSYTGFEDQRGTLVSGAVTNTGTIYGAYDGVQINQNTAVATYINNAAGALIAGGLYGIQEGSYGPGHSALTLINNGTISGHAGIILRDEAAFIIDAGTIIGTGGVALSAENPGVSSTLALSPAAYTKGEVGVTLLLLGGAEFGAANQQAGSISLNLITGTTNVVAAGERWQLNNTNIGGLPDYFSSQTVINYGTLLQNAAGVVLAEDNLYNYGVMRGSHAVLTYGAGYIYNAGLMKGGQYGVVLTGLHTDIVNAAAGTIAAPKAVTLSHGALYNYGLIDGAVIEPLAYNHIYNYAGGRITSTNIAVTLASQDTLYNAGLISGASIGIQAGILSTITNFGTIAGGRYAVDFDLENGSGDRLILAPTAVIQGELQLGGNAVLELLKGKTAGTLGANLLNPGALAIARRADWTLGAGIDVLRVQNDGTLDLLGAATIRGQIDGKGTISFAAGLTLDGAVYRQYIAFSGAETLALGQPREFLATIQNFAAGDTIDLTGVARENITGETFLNDILTLTATTGALTLTFSSAPAHDTFSLIADGAGTGIILAKPTALTFAAPATQASPPAALADTPAPAPPPPASLPPTPTPSGFLPLTPPPKPALLPAITLQS